MKIINIPALACGDCKQYSTSSPELKNLYRAYGCFNWLDLCNDGDANLVVSITSNQNRSIDDRCHNKITDCEFTEFVVCNVDTTDPLLAGEAFIYVGYNVEGKRENYLVERLLGGNRR
jgi:hypothetical protein